MCLVPKINLNNFPSFFLSVRKSILRNPEIPLKQESKSVKHVTINQRPISSSNSSTVLGVNKNRGLSSRHDKFTRPTLNSTAKISQKIKDIEKGKGFSQNGTSCITATSAALMQEKLTQQLNFPVNRSVFHGLCPVNVNDSVLEIDIEKTSSKRFSMPKHRLERDPEPNLQDFLDPVVPFEEMDEDEGEYGGASFIEFVPVRHQPPMCTSLDNVQKIFEFFD